LSWTTNDGVIQINRMTIGRNLARRRYDGVIEILVHSSEPTAI